MNQEKVGLFLKKLREERNLTQEEVAKEVFRGRDAISKWERSKNLPDTETLILLSEFYNVTINEILAGEKNTTKDVTLELYDDRNKLNKKIKYILAILTITIILSILSFLGYYFINQYKSIRAYTITGESENFKITNGLFIKANMKYYFSLGSITSENNEEITRIELYYNNNDKEELICSRDSSDMLILDYKGYEEYFEIFMMDDIFEELYLKLYTNDTIEIIELVLVEDYVNDHLIFDDDYKVSSDNKEIEHEKNDDIILKIKSKFIKNGNIYEYKLQENKKEKYFTFSTIDNLLILTITSSGQKDEEYVYDLETFTVNYNNYVASKLNYTVIFHDETYECLFGKCTNQKMKIQEFFNLLDEVLK